MHFFRVFFFLFFFLQMDTIKSSYYESKMDCYCECYFQLKYSGPVDVTELSLTLPYTIVWLLGQNVSHRDKW